MKSVVTEIRGNTAVLLSDDGCIVKVKNKNYELGQEIGMNTTLKFNFKKAAAFVAAACFVLVLGGTAVAYNIPTTYLSVDVNPSIEYSINMFNRVLSAEGVNDDGTKIVDEIDLKNLKNKTIDEAIALTVEEVARAGYLNADGAGIVITASSDDMEKSAELAEELAKTAGETCEENNCEATVNAEAVGKARVEEAKKIGVTPGKLNLVEKLKESAEDPDSIDINEWVNKSVKDIMAQTKQNKEQRKNQEKNRNIDEEIQDDEQNNVSETDESIPDFVEDELESDESKECEQNCESCGECELNCESCDECEPKLDCESNTKNGSSNGNGKGPKDDKKSSNSKNKDKKVTDNEDDDFDLDEDDVDCPEFKVGKDTKGNSKKK
ncbi:MAG: hypothetical protein PHY15_07335 [Eubacteriales bacterium]|nr:hypothetical protein [Eubacteriales bacterium]MDD4475889.1 hypothetical protein [Eubacteriales bacterium]